MGQNKKWQQRVNSLKKDARKVTDPAGFAVPGEDTIYDVTFCPFLPAGAPPIFAFTSGPNIFVARLLPDSTAPFSIVHAIEDADESRNTKTQGSDSYQAHNSLAWSTEQECCVGGTGI